MDEKANKPLTFDDILGLIGGMGRYQIVAITMICYAILPEALNSMIYVFAGAKLDHWCAVDQWRSSASDCLDMRASDLEGYRHCAYKLRDASTPRITYDDGSYRFSQCSKYDLSYPYEFIDGFYAGNLTNSTMPCDDGWEYDREQYISTIVSDVRPQNLR